MQAPIALHSTPGWLEVLVNLRGLGLLNVTSRHETDEDFDPGRFLKRHLPVLRALKATTEERSIESTRERFTVRLRGSFALHLERSHQDGAVVVRFPDHTGSLRTYAAGASTDGTTRMTIDVRYHLSFQMREDDDNTVARTLEECVAADGKEAEQTRFFVDEQVHRPIELLLLIDFDT